MANHSMIILVGHLAQLCDHLIWPNYKVYKNQIHQASVVFISGVQLYTRPHCRQTINVASLLEDYTLY
jgi:hypothetical protein